MSLDRRISHPQSENIEQLTWNEYNHDRNAEVTRPKSGQKKLSALWI